MAKEVEKDKEVEKEKEKEKEGKETEKEKEKDEAKIKDKETTDSQLEEHGDTDALSLLHSSSAASSSSPAVSSSTVPVSVSPVPVASPTTSPAKPTGPTARELEIKKLATCPKCTFENKPGARGCEICGAALPPIPFPIEKPKGGTEGMIPAWWCPQCAHHNPAAVPAIHTQDPYTDLPPPSPGVSTCGACKYIYYHLIESLPASLQALARSKPKPIPRQSSSSSISTGPWKCSFCTFINESSKKRICDMCAKTNLPEGSKR